MGAFDDLIPASAPAAPSTGAFTDLVPQAPWYERFTQGAWAAGDELRKGITQATLEGLPTVLRGAGAMLNAGPVANVLADQLAAATADKTAALRKEADWNKSVMSPYGQATSTPAGQAGAFVG